MVVEASGVRGWRRMVVEAWGARGWPCNRRWSGMVWQGWAQCVATNGGRGVGGAWVAANGGGGVGECVCGGATGVAQRRDAAPPSTEMRHHPALSLRTIRTLSRPIH